MKIIPAIDLIDGKTVRLEQGKYDAKLSYDVLPIEAARRWEQCGAEYLHIIDLDGAKKGEPVNLNLAGAIVKEVSLPVEIGGGYRNKKDIDLALAMGFDRVIVGSKVFEDKQFAADIIKSYGNRIIISVDATKDKIKIHGWETAIESDLFEVLDEFISFGLEEIIYTDISKDGTLAGPDTVFLRTLLERTGLKITYAGGIKNVEHILALKDLAGLGVNGVIVGRALYDKTIDLEEAINACKENNTMS
jgi:phosphoribosylformimino-5-aminoimidazole carboxamide ribotide isomerase